MPTPSLFVVPIEKYKVFPAILIEVVIYALAVSIFNLEYRWFRCRNHSRTCDCRIPRAGLGYLGSRPPPCP